MPPRKGSLQERIRVEAQQILDEGGVLPERGYWAEKYSCSVNNEDKALAGLKTGRKMGKKSDNPGACQLIREEILLHIQDGKPVPSRSYFVQKHGVGIATVRKAGHGLQTGWSKKTKSDLLREQVQSSPGQKFDGRELGRSLQIQHRSVHRILSRYGLALTDDRGRNTEGG